ncbi:MAG: hypothetical protein V7K38_29250 [Nostoc sp.]
MSLLTVFAFLQVEPEMQAQRSWERCKLLFVCNLRMVDSQKDNVTGSGGSCDRIKPLQRKAIAITQEGD